MLRSPLLYRLSPEPLFEVVEHKALGHPDTLCDAVAEEVSLGLCHYYRKQFGCILHHNVDKALLIGGQSTPRWGGGTVDIPMELILAGRAATHVEGVTIPVEELAREATETWVRKHLREVRPDAHMRMAFRFRPGARNLVRLVESHDLPRSNDTSVAAGHAPATRLEAMVRSAARWLYAKGRDPAHPFVGIDGKIMGFRREGTFELVVALALVDRYLVSFEAYKEAREFVRQGIEAHLADEGHGTAIVRVNVADGESIESIFLTVLGTSAEAGDDGQVGRGNRLNGLITPGRPMTLEAPCGKNPISHAGKLYAILAQKLADALVQRGQGIARADVLLASAIGAPVNEPEAISLGIEPLPGAALDDLRPRALDIVDEELAGMHHLLDEVLQRGGVLGFAGIWS